MAGLQALIDFLEKYKGLWDCSVVEIFNEQLWQTVPGDWLLALRDSAATAHLQIPTGYVQDSWPPSLKDFIRTAQTLSLERQPGTNPVPTIPPPGPNPAPPSQYHHPVVDLDHVVAQGMSPKKRHEVAALAALVAKTAKGVGATTVVDIGAGQGYLSNVLYYQYGLDVIAVDAAPGHAGVMQKRSVSISKYFRNLRRKAQESARVAPHLEGDTCLTRRGEGCETDSAAGDSRVTQPETRNEDIVSKDASCEQLGKSLEGQSVKGRARKTAERWTWDELQEGPIAITSRIDFDDAASFLVKLKKELSLVKKDRNLVPKVVSGGENDDSAAQMPGVKPPVENSKRSVSPPLKAPPLSEPNEGDVESKGQESEETCQDKELGSDSWQSGGGAGKADLEDDREAEGEACHLLDGPVVLAGLHACGDLSASMLRTFKECPGIAAVVVVSCCYNLVTEAPSQTAPSPSDHPQTSRKTGPKPTRSDSSGAHQNKAPMHSPSDHPQTPRLTVPKPLVGGCQNSASLARCSEPSLNSVEETFATLAIRPARTGGCSHQKNSPVESCSEPLPTTVGETFEASEAGDQSHQRHGFPLSSAIKAAGFTGLGINGRMLACQSADRWRSQSEEGFREVIAKHTLRAAFQSLLAKHFPSVWSSKPVLGKQKKQSVGDLPGGQPTEEKCDPGVVRHAVKPASECATVGGGNCRKGQDGVNERRNEIRLGESTFRTIVELDRPSDYGDARPPKTSSPNSASMQSTLVQNGPPTKSSAQPNRKSIEQRLETVETLTSAEHTPSAANGASKAEQKPLPTSSSSAAPLSYLGTHSSLETGPEESLVAELRTRHTENGSQESASERARFLAFARESLQRLGLPQLGEEEVLGVWNAILPYKDLVGPFWTLRTAMAGPLESLLLLDRLLYMDERLESRAVSSHKVEPPSRALLIGDTDTPGIQMFPLFDPAISPRNMVLVGRRL